MFSILTKTKNAVIILVFSLSLWSCQEKYDAAKYDDIMVTDDDVDKLFEKYNDSLTVYFGNVEIDLIKQYKRNHEHIKTEEDFAQFARKSKTLRNAMLNNLASFSREHKLHGNEGVHDLPWFKDFKMGMDVVLNKNGESYNVFFSYDDWAKQAKRTKGASDDKLVELLKMVYEKHISLPKWYSLVGKKYACSNLGTGIHLKALLKMDEIQKATKIFDPEINDIRKGLVSDIIFTKKYCTGYKAVLKELKSICKKANLKENELTKMKSKIAQLESFDARFIYNCLR